jgi:hypothetical protein
MKGSSAPFSALAALIAAALAIPLCAQGPPAQNPPARPAAQQPDNQPPQPNPNSHVIFSRSTDENGETTTTVGAAAQAPSAAAAPVATDAEREAVTITAWDLDVHLDPAHQHIAVRAQLTARNDGAAPLAHIPLQISSSLDWESIRIDTRSNGAHDAAFETATLNSDADHTGQLHEAAVLLAAPLAPGATVALDVTYSGAIAQSAQRLTALGAPQDVALHSDWDQVGIDFTGLRGFGNVVWYPVSSVPVILGDGARLFDEIGWLKLREENTEFRLRLTCEFPRGQAPPLAHIVAVINGHPAPLTLIEPPPASGELSSFVTADFAQPALGFNAPSLFVATRTPAQAANATLWTLPEDAPAVSNWSAAATAATPFLENWLGPHPRSALTVLDLPDPGDAPFETGALLAAPVNTGPGNTGPTDAGNDNRNAANFDAHLQEILLHALTHAWLSTPAQARPAWLDEGVAAFMGALWVEKQQGRTRALESLEADRPALALAEPSSPGEDPGQPLREAFEPVYYRTKAAYVFWMLRDLAGDAALSAALRDYDPANDKNAAAPGAFEKLIESNSGELGSGESSSGRDLRWVFLDWVDADKGLPDIAITHVAIASVSVPAPGSSPSAAAEDDSGNVLVAVDLANSGYASAEIPVTVRTTETSVTQRVLVPARGNVTRRILVQGTPTQVQANDGSVPETQASVHITTLNSSGAP